VRASASTKYRKKKKKLASHRPADDSQNETSESDKSDLSSEASDSETTDTITEHDIKDQDSIHSQPLSPQAPGLPTGSNILSSDECSNTGASPAISERSFHFDLNVPPDVVAGNDAGPQPQMPLNPAQLQHNASDDEQLQLPPLFHHPDADTPVYRLDDFESISIATSQLAAVALVETYNMPDSGLESLAAFLKLHLPPRAIIENRIEKIKRKCIFL